MFQFNKIVLGSAQFGLNYGISNKKGKTNLKEIESILDYAFSKGIGTIDTASSYGDAETILGKFNLGKDWKIYSKLSSMKNQPNVENLPRELIYKSLERLKIDCLEGVFFHHPNDLLSEDSYKIIETLDKCVSDSLIKSYGISIYESKDLDFLSKYSNLSLLQVPRNVLDRRFSREEIKQRFTKNNIKFFVRSVFLQGLLLMDINLQKKKFPTYSKLWEKWNLWLEEQNISPLEACLSFFQNDKNYDKLIIGVESKRQLQQILNIDHSDKKAPDFKNFIDSKIINPSKWKVQ